MGRGNGAGSRELVGVSLMYCGNGGGSNQNPIRVSDVKAYHFAHARQRLEEPAVARSGPRAWPHLADSESSPTAQHSPARGTFRQDRSRGTPLPSQGCLPL